MRKAIILSGPIASGKTTIARGIKDFYELGEWIYTNNHRKAIYYQDLTTFKLVILDECIGLPEIESFEPLREKYPHCNFIFCTQSDIKKVDNDKYNLIGCRPLHKCLVIPDYEHTPPPPPSPVKKTRNNIIFPLAIAWGFGPFGKNHIHLPGTLKTI